MDDSLGIEILNWAKYQGEARRHKTTSWFALDNKIWMHTLWDDLTDHEFRAFIRLLCHVSCTAHRTGIFVSSRHHLKVISGLSTFKILDRLFFKLEQLQIIKVHKNCSEADLKLLASCPTQHYTTKHSKRDLTDYVERGSVSQKVSNLGYEKPKTGEFDFFAVKDTYPSQLGLTEGVGAFRELVKDSQTYDDLKKAIRNYADHCKAENIQPRYIKRFDGFLKNGYWRDWIETENGKHNEKVAPIGYDQILWGEMKPNKESWGE